MATDTKVSYIDRIQENINGIERRHTSKSS